MFLVSLLSRHVCWLSPRCPFQAATGPPLPPAAAPQGCPAPRSAHPPRRGADHLPSRGGKSGRAPAEPNFGRGTRWNQLPNITMLTINAWAQYMEFEHVLTIVIKGSFIEETPSCGLSHSHQPRDPCVQLACALRDHELTVSPAQRSLCPVGMCLKRS